MNASGLPEHAAATGRRMQAWQRGHLSGVESVEILAAVERLVVDASRSLRDIRAWCDDADKVVCSHQSEHECVRCETVKDCSAAIRTLLSDGPSSVGEVEMAGTRVTPVGDDNHWRDREYPGGTDSGN